MKKFIYAVSSLLFLGLMSTSCDLFKLDNFDGPDATFYGRLIDATTKENIQIETYGAEGIDWDNVNWSTWYFPTKFDVQAGCLTVIEDVSDRWEDSYEEQKWLVKFDGSYKNSMVFAGKYSVDFLKIPAYAPAERPVVDIKKGDNEMNFELQPYCRIKDVNLSWEESTKRIKATFKVELGDVNDASAYLNSVQLCSNPSNFVSHNFNYTKNDPGAKRDAEVDWSQWWLGPIVVPVPTNEDVTLYIDTTLDKNLEEFQYNRNHYIRIAAQVSCNANTNSLWNHSEIWVMDKNHNFTKYDWASAN